MTRAAFENAIRTNGAIGGSTNAVIHLLAIAGRVEVDLTLEDWDVMGRDVPTIVNLRPNGKYLMENFYYAGGLPVVLRALGEGGVLNKEAITVSGGSIWDEVKDVRNWNDDVIRPLSNPLPHSGGIAVLRGNLAAGGAILKPSAASPDLMQHRGRALVFDSIEDYHARIDLPDLDVDRDTVLILKNCGPVGYPGMAEVGNMGLPSKILKQGVTDMVRISDARMSGTAYGTVILHVTPEAAAGGVLSIVETGDFISIDVDSRKLELEVDEQEISDRLKKWTPPQDLPDSGYAHLYVKSVTGADTGADFDFLLGCRGDAVKRHSH
jgi:L-arabonate dehydrase